MPRLHRRRNVKLTLLCSRSDGDGLSSVQESGKSATLRDGLPRYLKHGNGMIATNRVYTAIEPAPTAANAKVKSP